MKRTHYVYNRKLEDEALRNIDRSERPWSDNSTLLSRVEGILKDKRMPVVRLGDWALVTTRLGLSTEVLQAMVKVLTPAMLNGMQAKGLSTLAICRPGRRPVLYERVGKQTFLLKGTAATESWASGTRVVHMSLDGNRVMDIR